MGPHGWEEGTAPTAACLSPMVLPAHPGQSQFGRWLCWTWAPRDGPDPKPPPIASPHSMSLPMSCPQSHSMSSIPQNIPQPIAGWCRHGGRDSPCFSPQGYVTQHPEAWASRESAHRVPWDFCFTLFLPGFSPARCIAQRCSWHSWPQ